MSNKNNTNKKDSKKEKKKVSPKLFIIIGAAIAALALTLFLIFDDGLPKNVKDGAKSTLELQLGCEVSSLKSQKKYKVKNSEYDKETIYLVRGILKSQSKYSDGYYVLALVAEIEDGGEEKIVCKRIAMNPDKEVIKEQIKAYKNDPASWAAEIERQNEYLI